MALSLTIAGVNRTAKLYNPDVAGQISGTFQAGQLGSFKLSVYDLVGASGYRPALDDTILLEDGATPVLYGILDMIEEDGLTSLDTGVVTAMTGSEYYGYAQRVSFTGTFAAGSTLKAALTTLVAGPLATFGITLDAAQATGPTFSEDVSFTTTLVSDVLARLMSLTGWVPRLQANLALLMIQPGSVSCGYSLSDGDTNTGVVSRVTMKQSRTTTYANTIILSIGDTGEHVYNDPFTGDGVTSVWTLTLQPVLDVNNFLIPVGTGVTENGTTPTMGRYGIDTADYLFDYTTNQIHRSAGAAPVGTAIVFSYQVQYPQQITYIDSAEVAAHKTWEGRYSDANVFTFAEGLAEAQAIAARTILVPQIVTVATTKGIAFVGESIVLSFAERAISGTFMIIGVDIATGNDGVTLEYTLTCVSGTALTDTWLNYFKEVVAGATGAGSVIVSGGGGGGGGGGGVMGPIYLGGSRTAAVAPSPAGYVGVSSHVPLVASTSFTATLRAEAWALHSGVTATVRLRNLTDGTDALVLTGVTSQTPTEHTGTVAIVSGKKYELQVSNSASSEPVFAIGQLEPS